MTRLAFLAVLLVAAPAHGRPGQLRPPARAAHVQGTLAQIEKPGAGEPPDDSDDATYRADLYTDRDPAQAAHEEATRRLTDRNDAIRDNLRRMQPGEIRWIWYSDQGLRDCGDHGCTLGPIDYAVKLELVSVARHRDDLPDGMHIDAWPELAVRAAR